MEPTLCPGDLLLVRVGAPVRPDRIAVVQLPPDAHGQPRPVAVKRVTGHDPADPDWGTEPEASAALLRTYDDASTLTESRVELARGNWPAFYRGVEQALRGSAEPPVLVDGVIANLRVLGAAREAALIGSSVRLDPPAGHRAWSTS